MFLPVIAYERKLGPIFLRMGIKPVDEDVGVASIRKPEMASVLERQVRVMAESLTSEMRTRRGGLISGRFEGEKGNRKGGIFLF